MACPCLKKASGCFCFLSSGRLGTISNWNEGRKADVYADLETQIAELA